MAIDDPGSYRNLRHQLSALRGVFALSNSMLAGGSREEILRMALSSMSSAGTFRPVGVYLTFPDASASPAHIAWSGPNSLVGELDQLSGNDAVLNTDAGATDEKSIWATSMHSGGDHQGYLVVAADNEPTLWDRFLLGALAQQTGAALKIAEQSSRLLAAQRIQAEARTRLEATVTELLRRTHAHELMTDATVNGDPEELLQTAYALTHLPAAIVDQFGYLQASVAGGDARSDVWRQVRLPNVQDLVMDANAGRSTRIDSYLVAVAKLGGDVLGAVVMSDVSGGAGAFETYVLERTARLLTGELAHRRAIAEMETRLRRELVVELVEGLDEEAACSRAALLGHDLRQPHQVAAIRCHAELDHPWLEMALRRVTSDGALPMVGTRRGLTLVIVPGEVDARALHDGFKQVRPVLGASMGVGGRADGPRQIPRSYAEALRALQVRERSPAPDGGTNFSELGLYQIMDDRERGGAVDRFVLRWLGALIDYDAARHAELVNTLAHFLDCGGNYDLAAHSLLIHRSTLRYRLKRIRDLGGLDLADVETRLNVHVATKAWRVLEAR
jgi:sugar diacid utilization regulator